MKIWHESKVVSPNSTIGVGTKKATFSVRKEFSEWLVWKEKKDGTREDVKDKKLRKVLIQHAKHYISARRNKHEKQGAKKARSQGFSKDKKIRNAGIEKVSAAKVIQRFPRLAASPIPKKAVYTRLPGSGKYKNQHRQLDVMLSNHSTRGSPKVRIALWVGGKSLCCETDPQAFKRLMKQLRSFDTYLDQKL